MGPSVGLGGRKFSPPPLPGNDPGPLARSSVAIPTELPDPRINMCRYRNIQICYLMAQFSEAEKL